MENKINIAELLKDCPSGMELDCTLFEGLEFDDIIDNEYLPIRCRVKNPDGGYNVYNFTKYGCWLNTTFAKCVIFLKGKTTWEGFQRPFKDGDIVVGKNYACSYITIFKEFIDITSFSNYVCLTSFGSFKVNNFSDNANLRLATEEEKEKLFKAIKDNGYKWNSETKTLEKLVKPKFKVGDVIQDIDTYKVKVTEVNIEDECYGYESMMVKRIGSISFSEQDDWELVPNKFDINTLVPFESRVLVRDNKLQKWHPAMWGFYDLDFQDYPYKIVGAAARYCIPYEKNEYLLGTTDDCDEFYKNW